jgi:iron complex outermembrane receptor protein
LGVETIGQGKGFYYNPNSRKYYDHTDGWIARGQLRYRKGPLDIDFSVDAQDLNLPTFLNTYVAPPGANAALPLGLTQDRFVMGHDGPDGVHQQAQRAMILADYDLGWGKLTSDEHGHPLDLAPGLRRGGLDFATEANLQKSRPAGVCIRSPRPRRSPRTAPSTRTSTWPGRR